MKRPRDECPDARKRNKHASQQCSGQPDGGSGPNQQCSTRNQVPIAQQLQQSREHALQSFDVQVWGQEQFSSDLEQLLTKLFKDKAVQPNAEDKCWHLDGTTLMDKEAVLAHYPNLKGIFQNKVESVPDLKEAKAPARKTKNDQVVSGRYDQLAVFNFQKVTMYDEEAGECFTVSLGDSVIVSEFKNKGTANGGGQVEVDNIIRVTEIFMNTEGEFLFRGHYYYQDIDTAIAAAPKKPKENGELRVLPSGDHLSHPRRLWLCGSEDDNDTYENCYHLSAIDRVTKVYQIPPGLTSPDQVPELQGVFNPEEDWFYNQYTVQAFISVEDMWEDWMPWSLLYKEVWQKEGAAGIKKLRESCENNFTKLMRGASKKKLDHPASRVLYVLELFAGGGGLSHICRRSGDVEIRAGWANDINQSACATYNCNERDAYVFCQGLEELLQLLVKWGKQVDLFLGQGWQQKLESIRQHGPQHKYSRRHMPKGVGCLGTTANQEGTSGDIFVAAAERGWAAVKAKGLEEDADCLEDAPDWDALIDSLAEVDVEGQAGTGPEAPELVGSAAEKSAIKKAFDMAVEVQQKRIEECKKRVNDQELGKVLEVRDVRVTDCAVRVKHGSSKNQLDAGLTDYECWLEYEVKREGSSDWIWEHQSLLCEKKAVMPMRHFMLRMIADKAIPLPGDVDLLTGGPPCQNMSGLNRHAKQEQVLLDPKNRLVMSYVHITKYLKPSFVLMEQVTDVFRKELALYARYALQQMIEMNYQCRAGICTAGNYGCPQGRRRALFWGALSGKEQLPPFPAPTHVVKDFNMGFPQHAAHSRVELPDEQRRHPMVLMGDVLTDLPAVDNFDESDRTSYACPPRHVTQAYLRRSPAEHSRALVARAVHADAAMAPWQKMQSVADELEKEEDQDLMKVIALGMKVLCKNKGPTPSSATTSKGAKKGKSSNKSTPATTPAATPAASGDGGDGEAEDEEDEVEQPVQDDDDMDDNAAQDNAELAAEVKESKNFANQTWQSHVNSLTDDPVMRDVMHLLRDSEEITTAMMLGKRRMKLLSTAARMQAEAPLRDHRSLMCNADDYGRMCAVPRVKGANFRDMPGVVTHSNKTCCAGSWHSDQKPESGLQSQIDAKVSAWHKMTVEEREETDPIEYIFADIPCNCACPGGGMPPRPPKGLRSNNGNDKTFRVDWYADTVRGGWRGSVKAGCSSATFWLSTGDLVCPRWCVTYKNGLSNGRHGCFGRIWYDEIQTTVVTRAEPHNLQLLHPEQDRVLTVRENARCQGFPDYHVFIGLGGKGRNGSHGKGAAAIDERYMQIGNAVSPMLSACLGECLCLAAAEASPVAEGMVQVTISEYEAIHEECKEKGIGFWCKDAGNAVDLTKGNGFYWNKHLSEAGVAEGADPGPSAAGSGAAKSSAGTKRKNKGTAGQPSAVAGGGGAGTKGGASGSNAAAAAVAAAETTGSGQQQTNSTGGGAAVNKSAADAAAYGGTRAPRSGAQKRKHGASELSDAAAGDDNAADDQAGASNKRSSSRASKSARCGSGGGSGGGSSRPQRKSAAEAQEAVRKQLQQESTPLRKLRAVKLQQLQESSPVQDAAAQRDTSAAAAVVDLTEEGDDDQLLMAGFKRVRRQGAASAVSLADSEDQSSEDAAVDPSSNRSSVDVLPAAIESTEHMT